MEAKVLPTQIYQPAIIDRRIPEDESGCTGPYPLHSIFPKTGGYDSGQRVLFKKIPYRIRCINSRGWCIAPPGTF